MNQTSLQSVSTLQSTDVSQSFYMHARMQVQCATLLQHDYILTFKTSDLMSIWDVAPVVVLVHVAPDSTERND